MKKFVLLLLFLSAPLVAEQKVTMGLVVFPPYSILEEQTNKCVGRFIEITKKILTDYSIQLGAVCAPPARLFRLLEKAEIDFTINIKSTVALPKNVDFVEPPFSTLQLDLYSHKQNKLDNSVAAIRGYSYHGFRAKLVDQHYKFFDLPNSISAIQLFLKKRSSHLISYRAPLDYYVEEKELNIKEGVSVLPLVDVATYIVISKQSPHLELLKTKFEDYAAKHQLQFFDQVQ